MYWAVAHWVLDSCLSLPLCSCGVWDWERGRRDKGGPWRLGSWPVPDRLRSTDITMYRLRRVLYLQTLSTKFLHSCVHVVCFKGETWQQTEQFIHWWHILLWLKFCWGLHIWVLLFGLDLLRVLSVLIYYYIGFQFLWSWQIPLVFTGFCEIVNYWIKGGWSNVNSFKKFNLVISFNF